MSVNLVKGQKINLSKEVAGGLTKIMVGLGWDAVKKGLFGSKPNIDCDASAIILGKDDKYRTCVYYGDRSAEDKCVYHHGDNLTGDGDGDDEQITVDLANITNKVEKIVFVVNIYDCISRKQTLDLLMSQLVRKFVNTIFQMIMLARQQWYLQRFIRKTESGSLTLSVREQMIQVLVN